MTPRTPLTIETFVEPFRLLMAGVGIGTEMLRWNDSCCCCCCGISDCCVETCSCCCCCGADETLVENCVEVTAVVSGATSGALLARLDDSASAALFSTTVDCVSLFFSRQLETRYVIWPLGDAT